MTLEATARVTEYQVSCVPDDFIDAPAFALTVEWRGEDTWAICRFSRCLGSDGVWDHEPIPSDREDEWIATHRFTEDEALRLAKEAAPKVVVNGWTVAAVLAKGARL